MTPAEFSTVTTSGGPVRGRRHDHGTVHFDVPYAKAPLGIRRFAPPDPHPGWSGVRDGTRPGPTAPQPARDSFGVLDMSPYFGPGWQRGDDYLTVNVWAPPADGSPRPTLVFVHGGGFVAGSNRAPLYDGTAFARDGVVLVTVNYRLGIPGFLHLPDAPDNRGLLDVVAALRWVRDNVASFGGDPGNVTLAGQSAGAIIVGGVLAEPAAAGLFRRAIVQSGSGTGAFTPEQAAMVTERVGRHFGVEPSAAALAGVPEDRLVAVLADLAGLALRTLTHHHPLGGITSFSLVSERQPVAAAGGSAVDLLIGDNLDEGSLYLAPVGKLAGSTDLDVRETAALFHRDPADAVRGYRSRYPHAGRAELRTRVLSDGLFRTGTHALATAHTAGPTYRYEFGWRSDAVDGQLGASHVMELPFVFDNLALPSLRGPRKLLGTGEPPAALATRMHRSWVAFAGSGKPGWAEYSPGGHVEELA
ncbi:carboxylesterase family protein [Amycolatopsis sp. NPDC004169]|uniref:carboxylesterase/lipase family protein n=1 Tax=Amycolatopsis sp. NPDC004169 TaxID=3154453 RepID=UPI0033B8B6E9